ncbi:MAG: hypothetical protein IJH34_15250 [Romboutsia sp.]|nr:hypothetical protein [Romboutsia sp.]
MMSTALTSALPQIINDLIIIGLLVSLITNSFEILMFARILQALIKYSILIYVSSMHYFIRNSYIWIKER